jgi:RNA polymerase sigma factor (sigma-70 family)
MTGKEASIKIPTSVSGIPAGAVSLAQKLAVVHDDFYRRTAEQGGPFDERILFDALHEAQASITELLQEEDTKVASPPPKRHKKNYWRFISNGQAWIERRLGDRRVLAVLGNELSQELEKTETEITRSFKMRQALLAMYTNIISKNTETNFSLDEANIRTAWQAAKERSPRSESYTDERLALVLEGIRSFLEVQTQASTVENMKVFFTAHRKQLVSTIKNLRTAHREALQAFRTTAHHCVIHPYDNLEPQTPLEEEFSNRNFRLFIRSRPLLNKEERRHLMQEFYAKPWDQQNLQWQKHFIECNLGLVILVARDYVDRGLPLMDLIQEGALKLINAAKGFDPKLGNKFSSYACMAIDREFQRLTTLPSIETPSYKREQIRLVTAIRRRLAQELGREASWEELKERTKSDLTIKEEIRRLLFMEEVYGNSQYSNWDNMQILFMILDDPPPAVENLDEETLGLSWYDDCSPHAEHLAAVNAYFGGAQGISLTEQDLDKQRLVTAVEAILASLTHKEAFILKRRFGLDGDPPETLNEVGQHLGLSSNRVGQIEAQVMRKLRHPSKSNSLRPFLE